MTRDRNWFVLWAAVGVLGILVFAAFVAVVTS